MKKILKFLAGVFVGCAILVLAKLIAEACSPCMKKYFEVDKD